MWSRLRNWFNRNVIVIALWLAGIGFLLMIVFPFLKSYNDWSFIINPLLAGQFGDFIGGYVGTLFLLISIVLLYGTYQSQRESLREQQNTIRLQERAFQIQQFESKFFEMLKIHRDNVAEMESKGRKGKKVFVLMKEEFDELFLIVKKEARNNPYMPEKDIVNIAFYVLFFGIGHTSSPVLENILKKKYPDSFTDKVVGLGIFLTVGQQVLARLNEMAIKTFGVEKIFDGHQSQLSHYFRHLFQAIKFVHNQTFLSEDEKYFYVKTLRAQLSNFELIIFFYNSLSDLGNKWELDTSVKQEDTLITKYQFIKNIPIDFCMVSPKKYYPDIKYEWYE